MSTGAAVFDILSSDSAVATATGGRISPYARNRDDDFPAVTFSVPSEEPIPTASGLLDTRSAQVSVACMARRYDTTDDLAEKVIAAMTAAAALGEHPAGGVCVTHVRFTGMDRDFLDAYDGSVALIYRAVVNLTMTVEA